MRRRRTEVFSMSFLDCICCGFGAVILFYIIVAGQTGELRVRRNDDLAAEVNKLEEQVLVGRQNLVALHNSIEATKDEHARAAGRADQVIVALKQSRLELSRYDADSLARIEHINQLKADVQALEEGNRRLEGGTNVTGPPGENLARFRTGGDRMYLTGLSLKGRRIAILLDASASMLDSTVVNIIRLRNLPDAEKRRAAKWRRAIATAQWLTARMPTAAQFQVFAFNTKARPLVAGTEGNWLSGNDPNQLSKVIAQLNQLVPSDGTSLYNAFSALKTLNPAPDQIVLLTDGLPTQGAKPFTVRRTIRVEEREKLFEEAITRLPPAPVSVILFPMEGDVPAPARFWQLSRKTNGVFMMPSEDWP
jgi:outer membrane murein-binding lipoprotein Lpp